MRRKKLALLSLAALLCLLLSGCFVKTVDELYTLPRHSDEYDNLQKAIAEGMEQGWLDIPGLEAAYGIPLGEVWKPVLEQWERAGLVERDGAFIVLTLAGQFWQVNLSQLLLDYLKRSLGA